MTTFKEMLDEDLGIMLDDEEFGTEVIFKPIIGNPKIINGIFDKEFISVEISEGPGIQDQAPTLSIRLSDFIVEPKQNDIFTINGIDYKVLEIQKDGTGFAIIILEEN